MAARSAMGFAAGALRQTVARQTAPQFAPRPLAQQTRAMGASLPPPPHTPPSSLTPGTLSLARRIVAPGSSAPVHSHRAPRGSSSISAPRLTDPSRDPPPNPQAAATASRTRASPSTSRARFTSFGRARPRRPHLVLGLLPVLQGRGHADIRSRAALRARRSRRSPLARAAPRGGCSSRGSRGDQIGNGRGDERSRRVFSVL